MRCQIEFSLLRLTVSIHVHSLLYVTISRLSIQMKNACRTSVFMSWVCIATGTHPLVSRDLARPRWEPFEQWRLQAPDTRQYSTVADSGRDIIQASSRNNISHGFGNPKGTTSLLYKVGMHCIYCTQFCLDLQPTKNAQRVDSFGRFLTWLVC